MGLCPVVIPEPFWVIRGNKVRCVDCGQTFKTYLKYSNHWSTKHSKHKSLDTE